MDYAFKIDNPQTVDLAKYSADVHGKIDKVDAAATVAKLGQELSALQELLYASACNGVLIVLQGMDTSGKDGTIRHVFAFANPQGCEVASFKQPTLVEFAHDFLWRVHLHAPLKGMLNIFNRSHYEDVLVVRVHKLVDEDVIQRRFEQIVQFEELLTSNGTIILKFFLHISKDEQKERLLAREDDAAKSWKLSVADWHERQYWDNYQQAYADALGKTARQHAPWFIVPANHKWYRDLAISEALVAALKPYQKAWTKTLDEIGKRNKAALKAMREERVKPAKAPKSRSNGNGQ